MWSSASAAPTSLIGAHGIDAAYSWVSHSSTVFSRKIASSRGSSSALCSPRLANVPYGEDCSPHSG